MSGNIEGIEQAAQVYGRGAPMSERCPTCGTLPELNDACSDPWHTQPPETPDEVEQPYQAADVYNATRDKALYDWVAGLEASNTELRRERDSWRSIADSKDSILSGCAVSLRRYETALREADACLRDSHDHARPVHSEDRRWASVRTALSDSTTGDHDTKGRHHEKASG